MVSYSGGPVFIVLYTLGPTRQLVGRLPLSPKRITFRPKIAGAGQSTVLVEGSCEAVAPLPPSAISLRKVLNRGDLGAALAAAATLATSEVFS